MWFDWSVWDHRYKRQYYKNENKIVHAREECQTKHQNRNYQSWEKEFKISNYRREIKLWENNKK